MLRNVIMVLTAAVLGSAGSAENVAGTEVSKAPATEPVAKLVIHATLPDGAPAVGVPVHEIGPVRYRTRNAEIGKTDKDGLFRVGFQRGVHNSEVRPSGYGVYRYVLKPESYRWEISDIYCWEEYEDEDLRSGTDGPENFGRCAHWFAPGYDGALNEKDPANNWSYGKGVPLRYGGEERWSVRLQAGKTVDVALEDQFGKPVSNAVLDVAIDLMASTRTGSGAEIHQQRVETDADGRVRLTNVGDYAYQFVVDSPGMGLYAPDSWCWTPYVNHNLAVQGSTVRFQRELVPDVDFIVRDASTLAPIPGAVIWPVCQFPGVVQRIFPSEPTDGEGHAGYEKPMALEHCLWMEAVVNGYEDASFKMKDYEAGKPIEFRLKRGTSRSLEGEKERKAQMERYKDDRK